MLRQYKDEPMPIYYLNGDPALTRAQTLALSHNARGRTEMGELHTHLMRNYPVAFASYKRQCHNGTVLAGGYYLWRDSMPNLLFMTVRASAVGATRLRYIQSVVMTLARDYRLDGITSLAIAPLSQPHEWGEIRQILDTWFSRIALPVLVYDSYQPGIQADEPLE
jgi:hypothetical protein